MEAPVMELTGKQFEQLYTALLSAFPTNGELERFVLVELEQSLAAIAGTGKLLDVASSLVQWAKAQGRLEELVTCACKRNPLNPELRAFAEAVLKPRQLEQSHKTYLDYVVSRWEYLEMRGVARTSKTESLRLDEVYVSLTVERETFQNDFFTEQLDSKEVERAGGKENASLAELQRFRRSRERRKERIGLPEAVRENRCLVVLGDPGAGKTTLARFLALQFALACREGAERAQVTVTALSTPASPTPEILRTEDYGATRIPLLLRVADFAEALRKEPNLRVRDFLSQARGEAELSAEAATALFDETLTQGQALIILDGLDEVAQTADRSKIVRRISDFVNGLDAGNRLVVTSRIAGYSAARLEGQFFAVTMQDMEFEQIERFVSSRVTAYERSQTPGSGDQEILRRSRTDIEAILDAVQRNEGVKRLAVNPLLLTILCLIHRTGARMPERRVKLYEIVSETLLIAWRPANAERENCIVPINEADRLLAPLAHWMHEHTSNGLITEEKAKDLLQDFWAARYLVRETRLAPDRLRVVRYNPRFREVIRLAIASRTEEDAANLIRSAIWCPEEEAAEWGYISSPT